METVFAEKLFLFRENLGDFLKEKPFDEKGGGNVGGVFEFGFKHFDEFRIVEFPHEPFGEKNVLICAVAQIEMKREESRSFSEMECERESATEKIEVSRFHFELFPGFVIADDRRFPV